ncbi:MAG: NHL repeat-containing protein [Sedimentisphaerales bacterium]|jgi:hypothetical protein|nr:NHL repeat-containing protein [Sedimentisphaerales bacterium]
MAIKNKTIVITLILVLATTITVAIYSLVQISGLAARPVSRQLRYPIEGVKIDPNLILYQTSGWFQIDLARPKDICIDPNGLVYVVGDKAICVYESTGKMAARIDLSFEPYAVAVGPDGLWYLTAADHVEVYDRSGTALMTWPRPDPEALLTSIAVCGRDVFVADSANRIVYRYDQLGQLLGRIGQKDPAKGVDGLVVPSPNLDVACGQDGLLIVTNPGRHRVEFYRSDGQLVRWWGRFGYDIEGFTGCCNPVSIAALSDGGIVTAEKGLVRIKLFWQEGHLLGVVAGPLELGLTSGQVCQSPEDCQSGVFKLATDLHGRIYVLDPLARQVRVFARRAVL